MDNKDIILSIIIPVYNVYDYTEQCIKSVYDSFDEDYFNSNRFIFEVIVVDNNSYDKTPEELKKINYQNFNYFRMNKNLGFAKACNVGVEKANGQYLIFLNNDTYVFKNSLKILLESISSNDTIGIVGAKLLYPDYTIQHAGMALDSDYHFIHIYRGYPSEHPLVNDARSFQAVTGACFIIKKSDFLLLNGFNENYFNGYEDVDLCLRIIRLGKKVIYQPKSVLIHYESVSEGRHLTQEKAHELFKEKWKNELQIDYEEKTTIYEKQLLKKLEKKCSDLKIAYNSNLINDIEYNNDIVKILLLKEYIEKNKYTNMYFNIFEKNRKLEKEVLSRVGNLEKEVLSRVGNLEREVLSKVGNLENVINRLLFHFDKSNTFFNRLKNRIIPILKKIIKRLFRI